MGGARVGPLAGRAAQLAPDLRRALGRLPPATRRAVPLVSRAEGALVLPTLRPDPAVHASVLAPARLAATVEAILDEAGLRRMAKPAFPY
jgi:hypothetical protein